MTKINKGKLLLPSKCALIVKKIKIYKKKNKKLVDYYVA